MPKKLPLKPKANTQTKTIKSSNKRNILAGVIGAGGLLALGGGAAMLYRGKSRTQTERVEQVTKAVKVSTTSSTKAKQKRKDGLCTGNENLSIKPIEKCESKYITGEVLGQGKDGLVFETCLGSGQTKQCNFVTKIMTNPLTFCNELKSYSRLEGTKITPQVKEAYVCEQDGSRKYCIVMTKIEQTLTQFLKSKVDKKNKKVAKLDVDVAVAIVTNIQKMNRDLYKNKVCYLDWHLDNIMIDQEGELKLIDFSKDASQFPPSHRFSRLINNILWFIVMMASTGIPEGVWNMILELSKDPTSMRHEQHFKASVTTYTRFKQMFGDPLNNAEKFQDQDLYLDKISQSLKEHN